MLVIYTEYNVERKFFGLKTFAGYSLFLYATFLKVRLKILILTRFFAVGPVGNKLKEILSTDCDIHALLNSDGTKVRPESKIYPLLLRYPKMLRKGNVQTHKV